MNNLSTTTITIPDQTTRTQLLKSTAIFTAILQDNPDTTPAMTPVQIQDDSWPWSNSSTPMPTMTTPEYTFDLSGANESQLDGYVDTQFDSSRPGSELTTPVDHLAASPDIEGLGDESFNQMFMPMPDVEQLQFQQLVKDYPTSYSSLFAVTDYQTTTFQDSIVPQQPLMVSPMEFSSGYPDITHPSLFDPFTEEEIARMSDMSNMSSLNDPSMSMSGTVPNIVSGTGPDMGMGWPMPSSTVSGSRSGYQPLLSIPPILSTVPSPSPVPSACAPSPVNFASPSTYSPRTAADRKSVV